MMHAGILKKAGLYAILRVAVPLMPEGASRWLPLVAVLAIGNLLHCAWVALRQKDMNLLIGNSSLAHMGFAFLGIASLTVIGVTGTVLLMVAHALLAALSFALSGYLETQTGTLDMTRMGGLLRRMPFYGTALVMGFMAGCGLPGFANFAGEATILFGAWKALPPPGGHRRLERPGHRGRGHAPRLARGAAGAGEARVRPRRRHRVLAPAALRGAAGRDGALRGRPGPPDHPHRTCGKGRGRGPSGVVPGRPGRIRGSRPGRLRPLPGHTGPIRTLSRPAPSFPP